MIVLAHTFASALRRLKQQDREFEYSLGYQVKYCLINLLIKATYSLGRGTGKLERGTFIFHCVSWNNVHLKAVGVFP